MPGPFSRPADRAAIISRIENHPIEGDPDAMRLAFARLMLGDGIDPFDDGEGSTILGSPAIGSAAAGPVPASLTLLPKLDEAAQRSTGGGERYAPDRMIVWLHGGGYVFGSPETHARVAARMATLTGTPVLMPRYALAPERTWPAPLEDVMATLRPLLSLGVRVVLAGDSAGGHLALVVALECAKAETPVAGLVLCAPNTDRSGLSGTRKTMTPHDPMNADGDDRALATMMFGSMPDDHCHVSPVLDDLALLPPTHIEVGDREVLLGDSLVLHERAVLADAPTALRVTPGLLHMGQLWVPWWREAEESLERCAAHARHCLGLPHN